MPPDAGPKLLRDWIARAAQRDPVKPWIVCADDGRAVSYGELHDVTRRIATLLHDRGIAANDRVALLREKKPSPARERAHCNGWKSNGSTTEPGHDHIDSGSV